MLLGCDFREDGNFITLIELIQGRTNTRTVGAINITKKIIKKSK